MTSHSLPAPRGVALTGDRNSANPSVTPARCIAHVEVVNSLPAAESAWRSLENQFGTPYQRYDWAAAWQNHVGTGDGVTPFIIIGRDNDGTPLFLWPLGRRQMGPLSIAQYLGGKHANFNTPLWHRDVAESLTPADLKTIISRIAGADVLLLLNQPESWSGIRNPLMLLAHQASPSHAYRGALSADFEALWLEKTSTSKRKKFRKKEQTIGKHGALRYWQAATATDVQQILDAFFEQKSQRMREFGIADIFGATNTRKFIAAACNAGLSEGKPAIELYAFSVGETIAATCAGAVGGGRFCCMFNSMTRGPLAHDSPGELLLVHVVRACCQRGLTTFDLGIGEAAYKERFCEDVEPLFDSVLPLSGLGHVSGPLLRWLYAAKRTIKNSNKAWSLAQAARRRLRPG